MILLLCSEHLHLPLDSRSIVSVYSCQDTSSPLEYQLCSSVLHPPSSPCGICLKMCALSSQSLLWWISLTIAPLNSGWCSIVIFIFWLLKFFETGLNRVDRLVRGPLMFPVDLSPGDMTGSKITSKEPPWHPSRSPPLSVSASPGIPAPVFVLQVWLTPVKAMTWRPQPRPQRGWSFHSVRNL